MISRARNLVRDLWAGDVALATAFWEYAILYAILLNAAASMASLALLSSDEAVLGLIMHLLPAPYALLTFVAVWRAAPKYQGDPKWAGMARVAIAVIAPLSIIF